MRHDFVNNGKKVADIFLDVSKEKLNKPLLLNYKSKNKPLVKLTSVTKKFGKAKWITAVDCVNLSIYDNENIAFLGANGAGKTTIVEMIIGISNVTSGNIEYLYEYTTHFQEQLGIQFQDSLYPSSLKVKNIVNFMIDIYGVKIPKEELNHMVKMFGLEPFWNTFARSLSGGQQQRLNVLLALLHKPKIIFLDELSTGLDISVKQQIVQFIKQYCSLNNINIVLVSHDISEVEFLCDRIVIMQKGKVKVDISKQDAIQQFGSVAKLMHEYI